MELGNKIFKQAIPLYMFLYLLGVRILKLGFRDLYISKCQVSISKYETECHKLIITIQFVAGSLTG